MTSQLREYDNDVLNRHLDFFELVRREDEEEIAARFHEVDDVIHVLSDDVIC